MNILEQIIKTKREEVEERKALTPLKRLEQSIFYNSSTVSLTTYLKRTDKVGIIAEIKRASPSRGIINAEVDVERLSVGYMQSGASALSVLTDEQYFQGSTNDLKIARKYNYCPILRKDFIIDEYQVHETKANGADCMLLIASCLTPKQCQTLAELAKSLQLEVLLEVHDKQEIDTYLNEFVDIVGINNRDLKSFTTSIDTSLMLAEHIPSGLCKISESGISQAEDLHRLTNAGFDGFLIGTTFMQSTDPAAACHGLITSYNSDSYES